MGTATASRASDLVAGAAAVSSPPLVYEKLMQVINDPRSGAADIARVIGEDQGLTARVLKVVNSAFFSLPWKVDTVTNAVRVVGTSQIRDLALATSVLTLFEDVPEDLLDLESFWHHSFGCGVTARVIAGHRGEDNVERFLIAGLLHDIGRLIMVMNAPEESRAALEEAQATGRDLSECELHHLGCTHAQVGSALVAQWNFPPALQESVQHHHDPQRAERFPVEAATVHVADIVVNTLRWGRSGQARAPRLEASAWDSLGVEPALLPSLIDDAERQLEAAVDLLMGAAS